MTLKLLSDLLEIAKTKPLRTIAIAVAEDKPVLEAVKSVLQENIIKPVLIGNVRSIKEVGLLKPIVVNDRRYNRTGY